MSPPTSTCKAELCGDVIFGDDAFKQDGERPWLVVNNESHPFDGEQYVVMGLTTRTWYDDRVPLGEDDFVEGTAPRDSSVVPHAVTSLQPHLITEYVCRVSQEAVDNSVEVLVEYLS